MQVEKTEFMSIPDKGTARRKQARTGLIQNLKVRHWFQLVVLAVTVMIGFQFYLFRFKYAALYHFTFSEREEKKNKKSSIVTTVTTAPHPSPVRSDFPHLP